MSEASDFTHHIINGSISFPEKRGGSSGYFILFSFVGSLFSDTIDVYAVPNNGGWYNFGFALGAGAFGGSGVAASRR